MTSWAALSTPVRDELILGRAFAAAIAAVATDAVAEPFGRALPSSPEAFSDPTRFQRLVDEAAPHSGLPRLAPSRVRIASDAIPSSNCRNSVLAFDWPEDRAGDAWPRRLFLKQPSTDLPTRVFANLIGFWKIECAVCRNLAGSLPIDSPRIHAVAERRSRFFILMEDLRAREDARPFVNRDFLAGADVPLAERCVRTLARLHAHYVDWTPQRREAALPRALHPFLSTSLQPIMLAVNRLAVSRCQARSDGVFGEAEAALVRHALAHWPALLRAWYPEPLTLVHGDSHLGNFFESGSELGLLDFQGAHWGRGPRDVHYFLVNSMKPEVLARHEAPLLAAYIDERARRGAPVDARAAFDEYRGFSLQTLMTAVVSLGLGSFTDSEDVMRAMLARSVAALQRLDFAGWLDATIETRG